jgi:hypothetical protein
VKIITANGRAGNKKKVLLVIIRKIKQVIDLPYHYTGTDPNINGGEYKKVERLAKNMH